MTTSHVCRIAKVTLTDGNDAVLKRLEENVMENSISIPCEVGMKDTQQHATLMRKKLIYKA